MGRGAHNREGYKVRTPGSLKQAVAELVAACGGQVACSELCRVSKSQLHRYTDDSDEHQFTHMPADIVARLESHCGAPLVTRFLAAGAGCALIPLAHEPQPYNQVLSRIGRETGALFADGFKHISAGRVPPNAGRMRGEAMALMAALSDLLLDLGFHTGPP